jgi:hypothetical protein
MADSQVMIHVRFSADGSVTEISEKAAGLSPQDWFNRLSRSAGNCYQPLSGGRGVFRIARDEVEALTKADAQQRE